MHSWSQLTQKSQSQSVIFTQGTYRVPNTGAEQFKIGLTQPLLILTIGLLLVHLFLLLFFPVRYNTA